MKAMKRFAGILLALVMLLTMTVTTSFAAGSGATGSITVNNPMKDVTYTAYKIFDVTYEDGNSSHVTYSISTTSPWYDVVMNTDGTSKITGLKATKLNDTTYAIEEGSGFSGAGFAAALRNAVANNTVTDPNKVVIGTGTESGGTVPAVSKDNIPLGYYLVVGSKGAETSALCNLTTTNPNAYINDKNDITFSKALTDPKTPSVQVGQEVTFTLTGKMPDASGFEGGYKYFMSDTMSNGLSYIDKVVVNIGTAETGVGPLTATNGDDATVKAKYEKYFTYEKTTNGFLLKFKVLDNKDLAGKVIKVTYKAKVTKDAAGKIENNTATLEYSNNPQNWEQTKTLTDQKKVYSAIINILKHEVNNEGKTLDGAEFVLRRTGSNGQPEYYKYDATKDEVSWVSDQKDATVKKTENGGKASFIGLTDGEYSLKETKAPEGYKLPENIVATINIAGSSTNADTLTVESKVPNTPGSMLPTTGGIGTTIFYILGAILVIGAGVLLINRRRMNAEK